MLLLCMQYAWCLAVVGTHAFWKAIMGLERPQGLARTLRTPFQELLRPCQNQNGEEMSADLIDDYIDSVAAALGLPIEDAWKPAVRANLEVSLRMARLVDEFQLADETEPASVFTA